MSILPVVSRYRNIYGVNKFASRRRKFGGQWGTIGHGCSKRIFIDFLTKMLYITSQNVGNPVQIIKYVDLSRFKPILKL